MKDAVNDKQVHYAAKVIHRVDYITVLDKTKYSTVARRMLLLASAPNIKITKRGLILPNRWVEKRLHSYCSPAVCYETSVAKRLQALRDTSSLRAGSSGRELVRQELKINRLNYIF